MDSNSNTKQNDRVSFTEASASWNTRYVDPNGFECQLTLRADTGKELLEKVSSAITFLLTNDCVPYAFRRGSHQSKSSNGKSNPAKGNNNTNHNHSSDPTWCPVHQCEMKKWERDGRVWYSHKVNNDWCKGK